MSGLDARSVDVVTVAQAAHWLDLPAFYQEVRRVARPDAVLALIAYGVLHVEDEAVEAVASRFYHDALAPYWPPARRHVEQGYASLPFPFARIISPSFSMAMSWTLADMIGYVGTWSAVKAAETAVGAGLMNAFVDELTAAWREPSLRREIRWPVTIRVGAIE